MREFGQIGHIDLVGYCLAECYWQFHTGLLELARVEYTLHGHYRGLGIRNFYSDGAFPRYRGYDAYTESGKRQCYIILKIAYL